MIRDGVLHIQYCQFAEPRGVGDGATEVVIVEVPDMIEARAAS